MSTLEANTVVTDNGNTVVFSKSSDKTLANRLLAFIHGLDAEFPLSGGETNQELRKNIQYLGHEGNVFLHSADNSFPLTGA